MDNQLTPEEFLLEGLMEVSGEYRTIPRVVKAY
jgi:hypothetical protein